jgi:hypothetical protein
MARLPGEFFFFATGTAKLKNPAEEILLRLGQTPMSAIRA